MTAPRTTTAPAAADQTQPALGTYGHLAVFAWLLGLSMLSPAELLPITCALCGVVALVVYPRALRQILRLRYLVWMLLLALPTVFFLGERDAVFYGVPYSSEGLLAAGQIAMRYVVVLVALQGFTSAVEITALAGLLERFGLRGLGFSLGVALNLLPSLQQSSTNGWHALQMRGGLRRQRWRGLQLLVMTVVTNALRRAEEVALAAEVRAFSPEKARPMPVRSGALDWAPVALGLLSLLVLFLV
ncbi:MAG: energy-coupling factor transporter transmembrane protein EcfT [Anaerolineae bacterium]|nr:energy-coupling factor transporter transmembrane protein EcfT [Anaerolineae bacterium]